MPHADGAPERSVWIVNPYGTLPGESWATYRSTMLADCLVEHGYEVTQFISSIEHRSKRVRTPDRRSVAVRSGYTIEVVPSTPYERHVSLKRIRYERRFAANLVQIVGGRPRPAFVVLAEPALFYYDVLLDDLLQNGRTRLVLDLIDIWPELFEVVMPPALLPASRIALAPLFRWRRRLYARADAVVAVARDYADVARAMVRPGTEVEVVYWGYVEEPHQPTGTSEQVSQLISRKGRDEIWAIYAGTLGENYDIRALVEAANRLGTDPGSLVRIVVCGDGPMADYCREQRGNRFIFLGRLTPTELAHLYRHCDIALSTYKGRSTVAMPIKAFDYLKAGLPIVNSLGRDIARLLEEHDAGLNYDPSEAGALSRAIEALARDRHRRERMAANARRLGQEFAAERQYPKFVRLLERLARS